jgi:hypothetical protein
MSGFRGRADPSAVIGDETVCDPMQPIGVFGPSVRF